MSSEDLSGERRQLITEFKAVTGLESDENDDKIIQLLTINSFNLNNSISNYFDSGFSSIESHSVASGAEILDNENNDSRLNHRANSRTNQDSVINLQNQLFLDNFLPKLPKAPKISNHWQLEVGIYSSLNDDSKSQNTLDCSDDSEKKSLSTSPFQSLWLILLVIPKTLLQLIISFFKYFFGSSSSSKLITLNRFPKSFNYDNYTYNFKFLHWLANELNNDMSEGAQSDDNETSNEEKESLEKIDSMIDFEDLRQPSILDQYNIKDSYFNEAHENVQKNYSWLLVILVNNNKETVKFLTKLLTNSTFNKLFNKNNGFFKENTIFTQNIDKSPEAFEVGQVYKVKKIPYIMLISNVSSNPSILSSMSTVYKSNLSANFIVEEELNSTVKKIIRNLNKLLDSFHPQLITQRIDQQEIELARLIKQQQDDAYTQSLEKDRLKKLQKEKELKLKQGLESLIKKRENFLFKLIKDKWMNNLSSEEQTTKIAVKLPNGNRIIEVLPKSITANELYLFVELKLFINDLINSTLNELVNEDAVLNYIEELETIEESITTSEYFSQFTFKFELIQPFPKKIIKSGNETISTISELRSGANLLVEYIEDEDEDEDDVELEE